jgi:hypothetical protein
MKENKWIRLLAYVTGLVNQELLLQNEYFAAENRVLRAHLAARLRLSDPERSMLADIGKRLGRKALAQVASVAKPDTILAWYRSEQSHYDSVSASWAKAVAALSLAMWIGIICGWYHQLHNKPSGCGGAATSGRQFRLRTTRTTVARPPPGGTWHFPTDSGLT